MKRVIAKIKKAKGGSRIQLWRSSDLIFVSEVLTGSRSKLEKFIAGIEQSIRENGIVIEDGK